MREKLFRLSALLFDEGYKTRENSLEKIITFVFLDNSNQEISIKRIKLRIMSEFELVFSDTEIFQILKNNDNFILRKDVNDYYCKVTDNIFSELEVNYAESNTLLYFIKNFYVEFFEYKDRITISKFEDLLYTFMYDVYNGERSKISSLFNIDKIVVPTTNFTDDEVEWINGFLNWDNQDKNIAIYQIAALALEYCMISSNVDSSIMNDVVNGKTFYLDTNILIRLIGVGGERRLNQISYFLEKVSTFDCKILIGQNVMDEFERVLDNQMVKIQRFVNGGTLVPPSLCVQSMDQTMLGFYSLYYEWFKIKQSQDLKLFFSSLEVLLDDYMKIFNINIDESFSTVSINKLEEYLELVGLLADYKNINEESNYMDSVYSDVTSVIYMDKLRNGKRRNLSETMYIFISTDGRLINWRRRNYNDKVSLISKPSIWVNIILRFSQRYSKDDFICFTNYIQRTPNISMEKIDIEKSKNILTKIIKYTDIIEEQNILLNKVIEKYSISMINEIDINLINEQVDVILETEHKKLVDKQIKEIKVDADKKIDKAINRVSNLELVVLDQRKDMQNLKEDVSQVETKNIEIKKKYDDRTEQLISFLTIIRVICIILIGLASIFPVYLIISRIVSFELSILPVQPIIDKIGTDYVYFVISCALFAVPPFIKKVTLDALNKKLQELRLSL